MHSCTLLDLVAIKQDLEDLLGCPVDVVTKESLSPYITPQVLKEAFLHSVFLQQEHPLMMGDKKIIAL